MWCPYCPPFTHELAKFYNSIVEQKGRAAIDVIFISSDRSEKDMFEYYMGHHADWLTVPYAERSFKEILSDRFKVEGIPACFVIDSYSNAIEIDVRKQLDRMAEMPGPKQDADALSIYDAFNAAWQNTMKKDALVEDKENDCQIFCSLRYTEAMDEAKLVRSALKKEYNINAYICETEVGENIFDEIIANLTRAKLFLIFGSETYGQKTNSQYGTKEELLHVQDEKKPFFLIKMCDTFAVPNTRFILNSTVAYERWKSGTPMPDDLVAKIKEKYMKAISSDF